MDESAEKRLSLPLDDLLLPFRKRDLTEVLAPRTVLRNEAWPMLRVDRDLETSRLSSLQPVCPLPREEGFERRTALIDDPWVAAVHEDSEAPNVVPTGRGKVPVAEVKA